MVGEHGPQDLDGGARPARGGEARRVGEDRIDRLGHGSPPALWTHSLSRDRSGAQSTRPGVHRVISDDGQTYQASVDQTGDGG
ncbi:hypothetical protein GCM10010171_42090 [Actinokineospora fastidiosa]|uniref:Uncharacterized protein n=1 Tax=Actinokineospora fastidiosa TaxID=1816 RepID=A0A918GJS9_9PSEU|nr:hypothetical protein GCM10010171_42090 [Actinokineospora fastidiosa]